MLQSADADGYATLDCVRSVALWKTPWEARAPPLLLGLEVHVQAKYRHPFLNNPQKNNPSASHWLGVLGVFWDRLALS